MSETFRIGLAHSKWVRATLGFCIVAPERLSRGKNHKTTPILAPWFLAPLCAAMQRQVVHVPMGCWVRKNDDPDWHIGMEVQRLGRHRLSETQAAPVRRAGVHGKVL